MADETSGVAGEGAAGSAIAGSDPYATSASSSGTRRPGTSTASYGPTGTDAPKTDADVVVMLDKMFRMAVDHPSWNETSGFRKHAVQCFAYRENDQWTTEELAELKRRGQPDTRNNQIYVTVKRLAGQFIAQRTRLGFRGRTLKDTTLADTFSDLLLYIKQQAAEEYEEREQFEDGITGGMGVCYMGITFDDLYQPKIEIKHKDCFTIFPDPYSRRYDWNEDANFICEATWTDLDDLAALYPAKKAELMRMKDANYAGGRLAGIDGFKKDYYVDPQSNRIRPVSVWYKTKERGTLYNFGNGKIARASEITKAEWKAIKASKTRYTTIEKVVTTMHVGTYLCDLLLEHKESPYDHGMFPYVPYFVHRKKSGEPYSPIFIALTMQDAINKRESKAIHLLNTNQTITEDNNIPNEAEWAAQLAKPDGIAKARSVHPEKLQLRNNIEMAATQMEMHREGKADYRRIVGVNPDALGEKSEVRSGVGIARKQAMTDLIVTPDFDNFRRTRVIGAKLKLSLISQYFTEPQVLAITDDLGKAREINLTGDHLAALKTQTFDVVAADLPDVTTIQQEQFETMTRMLPQILPFGPFWTKKLFQISDLRDKDALIKEIDEMATPTPPDPKFSVSIQWAELPPEQQIAWAQKLGMPELAQAIQANPQPSTTQLKAEGDVRKEAARGQVERVKASGEQQKMALEIHQSEQEVVHAAQKHQLEMQKLEASTQAAMLKAAVAAQAPTNNGGSHE